MIYVVQSNNYSGDEYGVLYAGSSAHEALLVASKVKSCRISLWKNGKYFKVVADCDEVKSARTKGCGDI